MLFRNLVQAVRLYVRVEGVDVDERIKTFINDACLEFARLFEWRSLLHSDTLTTDDSGSYSISDLTSAPVANAISLGIAGQTPLEKWTYQEWVKAAAKTSAWAMLNGKIYVEGTGSDYIFLYTSCGSPYPLSDGSDQNAVTEYYSDIIIQMAILRYVTFLGDDESSKIEYARLQQLLKAAKMLEAREDKSGRSFRIGTQNR